MDGIGCLLSQTAWLPVYIMPLRLGHGVCHATLLDH